MKSPICDMLEIEFPLFAFSHCRDVVAAVSRADDYTRDLLKKYDIELTCSAGGGVAPSLRGAQATKQSRLSPWMHFWIASLRSQ